MPKFDLTIHVFNDRLRTIGIFCTLNYKNNGNDKYIHMFEHLLNFDDCNKLCKGNEQQIKNVIKKYSSKVQNHISELNVLAYIAKIQ